MASHRMYNEYLDEMEFADQMGFDGICVNEHHQNAYGLMPSPNLMAASLARRTSHAALALGAEGICMGTRFAASNECRWGEKAKRALIEAGDGATVAWGKTLGHGLGRTLKNKFTDKYLKMEGSGATTQELQTFMSRYVDPAERGLDRRAGAYFEEDIELGTPFMGAIAGLIKDIKPAAEIVSDIVTEAEKVLARLNKERIPARL